MQVNSEQAIKNAKRWGVRNNFHWLKLIKLQQDSNRRELEVEIEEPLQSASPDVR